MQRTVTAHWGRREGNEQSDYFGLEELTKVCIRQSEALEPVQSVSEGDKGLLGRIRVIPVVH
jgi:hypothetical protein